MAKKASIIFLTAVVFVFLSCAGPTRKPVFIPGSDIGRGTTLIVGRVVIEPEPEKGDKEYFVENVDGQISLFCENELRAEKFHANSFWDKWPVRIDGYEGRTFYSPVDNKRIYVVMAGCFISRGTSYEMIHLPVLFTIDINPGDKAVYIGTIRFKRDLFYNVKSVDVYDEYAKALPEFLKLYGAGVKLKKAVVKVLN